MNTYIASTTIRQLREMGVLYWYCNHHRLYKKMLP